MISDEMSVKSDQSDEQRALNTRIDNLVQILLGDLTACEMKWILFIAAAQSYRHDDLLKPCHSKYSDVENLRKLIAKVPSLEEFLECLMKRSPTNRLSSIDYEIIELLHWLFVAVRDPALKTVHRSKVSVFFFQSLLFCLHYMHRSFSAIAVKVIVSKVLPHAKRKDAQKQLSNDKRNYFLVLLRTKKIE